jgi:hypothetical protein
MSEKLFIYHSAPVDHIPKILQNGLIPSEDSYRGSMETDLRTTANKKGITLPVRRQECVFCYPSLRQAVDMTSFDNGTPRSFPPFFEREGLVVVDASSFQKELFVADFDFFSEIIDLRHMDEPDSTIDSKSYEAALTNYVESVKPFNTFDSIPDIHEEFRIPELLIEGAIPPTKIRETLLYKEIIGTGCYSPYPALPTDE